MIYIYPNSSSRLKILVLKWKRNREVKEILYRERKNKKNNKIFYIIYSYFRVKFIYLIFKMCLNKKKRKN